MRGPLRALQPTQKACPSAKSALTGGFSLHSADGGAVLPLLVGGQVLLISADHQQGTILGWVPCYTQETL